MQYFTNQIPNYIRKNINYEKLASAHRYAYLLMDYALFYVPTLLRKKNNVY